MKGARHSDSACDLTSSDSRSEDERRAVDFSARQRERGRLWRVFYSVPFVAFPCDHTGPLPQDRGASGRMSKTPPSCASASHSAVEHGNRMPSTTCAVGATSPSRDALGHERQNRGSEGRNRPAYLERREEHLDQRNGTRDCAQRLLYGGEDLGLRDRRRCRPPPDWDRTCDPCLCRLRAQPRPEREVSPA